MLRLALLLLTACGHRNIDECLNFVERNSRCFLEFEEKEIVDWCREHESHRTHEATDVYHYRCAYQNWACPASSGYHEADVPMEGYWYFEDCG